MHKFKVAIFDMDGLLLDSERLAYDAFLYTCKSFDLDDMTELFNRCVGTNSKLGEEILSKGLKGIADYKQFGLIWDAEYKKMTEIKPIPLMSGVEELLQHLKFIGTPMVVATSTNTKSAKVKLKKSGILNYFEFVIGGDRVKNSKPSPEIYLKVASELLVKPEDCLVFEDSANGVKSAVSAGMTVIQIPNLVKPDTELLKLGHTVLDSLSDVVDFFFSRNTLGE